MKNLGIEELFNLFQIAEENKYNQQQFLFNSTSHTTQVESSISTTDWSIRDEVKAEMM